MYIKTQALFYQAQAMDHLGDPINAIESLKCVYELCLAENTQKKLSLWSTADNLGTAYTNANLHTDSEKWHESPKNGGNLWSKKVKYLAIDRLCT